MTYGVEIRFGQQIVNWINQKFPERNWIGVPGPVSLKVGFGMFDNLPFPEDMPEDVHVNVGSISLGSALNEEIESFFNKTEKVYMELIESICLEIMKMTKAKDIYLYSLVGALEYTGDTTIYANWVLRSYFDE